MSCSISCESWTFSSWRPRGTRTDQPLSRKCRLISPMMFGVAYVVSSTPRLEVEAVDRLDQADRPDLDEIVELLARGTSTAAPASGRATCTARSAARARRGRRPRGRRAGGRDRWLVGRHQLAPFAASRFVKSTHGAPSSSSTRSSRRRCRARAGARIRRRRRASSRWSTSRVERADAPGERCRRRGGGRTVTSPSSSLARSSSSRAIWRSSSAVERQVEPGGEAAEHQMGDVVVLRCRGSVSTISSVTLPPRSSSASSCSRRAAASFPCRLPPASFGACAASRSRAGPRRRGRRPSGWGGRRAVTERTAVSTLVTASTALSVI